MASVRKVAEQMFDWTAMAREALGDHWAKRNAEERNEFGRLFVNLFEDGYLSKIRLAEADKFEYRGDTAITVTQPVLKNSWIDAGRLIIKLSKKDLKLTELGFQSLVMDILRRVAVTYYDLLAARDQVKVQLKAQELAQQLLAENKKKVEVGTMAPLDEKQAESQAAKAKADVVAHQLLEICGNRRPLRRPSKLRPARS